MTTRNGYRLLGLATLLTLTLAACGGGNGYGGSATSGQAGKSGGGSGAGSSRTSTGGLGTTSTPLGTILTDASGRTLYAFAIDSPGTSNCSGSCLVYWPADQVGTVPPKAPAGVTAQLGVLKRSDGTSQLTVDGYPAYTYVGDQGPGDTAGQGKNLSGGRWWVFGTNGHWIKSGSASGSGSGYTSSGGNGGY